MAPPRGDRRRRRAVLASCGAVAVALSWPATAEASAPRTVCTVQDERLAELSGLASNGQELFAVNDEIGRAACRGRGKVAGVGGAEDGIRDFHVTGVQTCALPISPRGDRRRRRAVLASCGAVAVALSWPATAEASAPRTVCTVQDERLAELSGLASNGQELFAVNDGGTQVEVFVLDRNCRVQRTITAGIDPYDVEDL